MDAVTPLLMPPEVRVLGCLVEKSVATPEYYPLSLSALTNACNQLSSRDPVVSYDETEVQRAVDGLRERKLASMFQGAESRVPRYKHLLTDRFLLTPAEIAVLCLLMLRGPQTVGELRSRSDRLHRFDSLAEVEESIAALSNHTPAPLVAKLPRQPGTKEVRYSHLLSSAVEPGEKTAPEPATAPDSARVAKLEVEVAALRAELDEIKRVLADFRKQFE